MLIKPLLMLSRFLIGVRFSIVVCHEGLPRSGKSYEAIVNQIIPALLKRRKVFSNIDGLNHQKFSEVTGLTIDVVNNLLIQLTNEQILTVYDHVENDSLVVIDELQDYFPSYNKKLDEGITKFVTQHGHRGIDVVVLGQAKEDFNILWRRRIDTAIYFIKRDAVGDYTSYTWISYKQNKGKFVKVRNGKGKYDSKYFDLYASHVADVEAIDTHRDDRVNILKSAAFKYWIPLFGVLFIFAIYYLYGVFHGDGFVKSKEPVISSSPSVLPVTPPPAVVQQSVQPVLPKLPEKIIESSIPSQEKLNAYKSFLDVYFKFYRPRLSGFVYTRAVEGKPARYHAEVQFYDETDKLKDSFSLPQLVELGYSFRASSLGLVVVGGGGEYVVKAWQLSKCGGKQCDKVGDKTQDDRDRSRNRDKL